MRSHEVLKPDIFSELILTVVGLVIFLLVASTLWMAIFHG
jgi:hypothetical protein